MEIIIEQKVSVFQDKNFLQDDYNRYETARSRSHASQRQREDDERSRFSGYGDRPGSGVEFMPTKWHGGEVNVSKTNAKLYF